MTKLYTLPTALGLGTLLAALCALSVTLVSGSLAQSLNVTKQFPARACIEATLKRPVGTPGILCDQFEGAGMPWTNVEALEQVLTPQNVRVESGVSILKLSFPEAKTVAFSFYQSRYTDLEGVPWAEEAQVAPGYLPVWDVLNRIAEQSGETVVFEGWDNPTVRLGEVAFQIGSDDETISGESFYTAYLGEVANQLTSPPVSFDLLASSPLFSPGIDYGAQRFDVDAEPGDIVGIMSVTEPYIGFWADIPPEERRPFAIGLTLDVGQIAENGSLTLALPIGDVLPTDGLHFVSAFSKQPQLGEAMLVRLTGEANKEGFGFEVIPPEQISLE